MFDLPSNTSAFQPMGERPSDAFIAAGVIDALKRDPDLKGVLFEVSVDNGVVTLRGTVRDAELRQRASSLAVSVLGVRNVINRINVLGEPA